MDQPLSRRDLLKGGLAASALAVPAAAPASPASGDCLEKRTSDAWRPHTIATVNDAYHFWLEAGDYGAPVPPAFARALRAYWAHLTRDGVPRTEPAARSSYSVPSRRIVTPRFTWDLDEYREGYPGGVGGRVTIPAPFGLPFASLPINVYVANRGWSPNALHPDMPAEIRVGNVLVAACDDLIREAGAHHYAAGVGPLNVDLRHEAFAGYCFLWSTLRRPEA